MAYETVQITRTYPTTPEGIAAWWSPDGFTVEVGELDLRPVVISSTR
ncbi:SRPBCC family protein [Spongiactinospora rosea]|nr:hypothetical protein [Spongiactinospora rosea]